jgi:hypothetical protein
MTEQRSISQQLGHISVEESTAAYATPLTPEVVSAILRDPDSPLYPSRIAVFCDECGTTESDEYMVSEEQTKAERLEVARSHLRKQGWQCDEDGDFCREHAAEEPEQEQTFCDFGVTSAPGSGCILLAGHEPTNRHIVTPGDTDDEEA